METLIVITAAATLVALVGGIRRSTARDRRLAAELAQRHRWDRERHALARHTRDQHRADYLARIGERNAQAVSMARGSRA